jgi:hypothetical protein
VSTTLWHDLKNPTKNRRCGAVRKLRVANCIVTAMRQGPIDLGRVHAWHTAATAIACSREVRDRRNQRMP